MEITIKVVFEIIGMEAYYIITVVSEDTLKAIKTHKRKAMYYRSAFDVGEKIAKNYEEKGYFINDIQEFR